MTIAAGTKLGKGQLAHGLAKNLVMKPEKERDRRLGTKRTHDLVR